MIARSPYGFFYSKKNSKGAEDPKTGGHQMSLVFLDHRSEKWCLNYPRHQGIPEKRSLSFHFIFMSKKRQTTEKKIERIIPFNAT